MRLALQRGDSALLSQMLADQTTDDVGSVEPTTAFGFTIVPAQYRSDVGKVIRESRGATMPPNKGMKQTSVERIGRSQLIPGVRRTPEGAGPA